MLGHNCRVFRFPRLKQIRDARQTTRNIACLGALLGNSRNDVANRNRRAVIHDDESARRQCVHRGNIGIGEADFLAFGIQEFSDRPQILTRASALLNVHDHDARQARDFVHLLRDTDTIDEVLELQGARYFGNNRVSVRVPPRHDFASRHLIAFAGRNRRAIGNLVTLFFPAEFIDHADFTGPADRDQVTLRMLDRLDVV